MVLSFFELLERRCREVDSLLCVGLDPHPDELPQTSAAAARDFCLGLIHSTAAYAAAFKPNSAFFEALGPEGLQALKDVIAAVPKGTPVILDAKRGDIASTANAYAQAVFQAFGSHAVTVSPYLGEDSLSPFLEDPAKGVFLLCKTSNTGSGDLQDVLITGRPLYLHVARLAQRWNRQGNLGLVAGATFPDILAEIRAEVPELWLLTPGVGAQGADLEAALGAGLRADGLGMLVPISRGISRAENAAEAARALRDAINVVRAAKPVHRKPGVRHARLADDLLRLGCVQFGEFKLKSGAVSPIYLDLRRLVGDPAALARAASAYIELMQPLDFDRIAGLPYAAVPIATAISLQSGWPLVYPRKETKEYGTKFAVEGPYEPGETVAVIDDLITTGGSKFEAIHKLEAAGLKVRDIVVLVDRRSGAGDDLATKGLRLHTVFNLPPLLARWRAMEAITAAQYDQVSRFLQGS